MFRTTAGRGFCHSSAARPASKVCFSAAWPAGSPACNRFSLRPFSGQGAFPRHFEVPAAFAGPPHMRQAVLPFRHNSMPHLCLPDCPCSASSITSEVFAFPSPYRASGWRRKRLLSQAPRLRQGLAYTLGKGILPASLSKGTETLSPASPAPSPINGELTAACCIFWMLNTLSPRPKLTAKAFYPPRHGRGGVSLKLTNRKAPQAAPCGVSPYICSFLL